MTLGKTSLSLRIRAAFLLLVLACGVLFGLLMLVFVYTTEDALFYQQLDQEIARQQALPAPTPHSPGTRPAPAPSSGFAGPRRSDRQGLAGQWWSPASPPRWSTRSRCGCLP